MAAATMAAATTDTAATTPDTAATTAIYEYCGLKTKLTKFRRYSLGVPSLTFRRPNF